MPTRRATNNRGKKRALQGGSRQGPKSKSQRKENLNSQLRQAIKEVKSDAQTKKDFSPDKRLMSIIPNAGKLTVSVYDDYSCTLNQTNIGQNNNKFYLIQLIEVSRKTNPYVLYTRWGRVGEDGQYKCEDFGDVDNAIAMFRSKFRAKTSNDWNNRFQFTPIPKKYVLLEMAVEEEEDDDEEIEATSKNSLTPKSKLNYRTQIMIKLIFSSEMFVSNMQEMNIDIKKMPLGKLSKPQIVKGLEVLLEIEKAFKAKKGTNILMDLSSKFYTVVPHDFGRNKPQIIQSQDVIDKKKETMMILSDIELAQSLQNNKKSAVINEIDEKYNKLNCELQWIPKSSPEYKMIEKYVKAPKMQYRKDNLIDIWRVDRKGETERMKTHKDIEYRKLLWHGTSVAVIAAILKAGLRIMPHSGGCVGRGIYFASDFTKSQAYMGLYNGEFEREKNIGFIFLAEVALGSMKEIMDGSCCSVTAAPKGYNSIVGRGQTEPDKKADLVKKFDDHDVIVPYGVPKNENRFKNSHFYQSEYLVYKESQAKIRYILKLSRDDI